LGNAADIKITNFADGMGLCADHHAKMIVGVAFFTGAMR
jgi:hypothetical protein